MKMIFTTCKLTCNLAPSATGRSVGGRWQSIRMGDAAGFRHSQVTAGGSSLHVVEAGDPEAAPFVFLHGWPESWSSWRQVMALASQQVRAVAIDLPGVGQSTGNPTDGSKQQLAETVTAAVVRDVGLLVHQGVTARGVRLPRS
jgi:alpha-beta hydrolase superfamily lysophospholipase